MCLGFRDAVSKSIGLRLTLWYACFFILSFLVLFVIEYFFISSIMQKDERREISEDMRELAAQYGKGGIATLREATDFEKRVTGENSLLVRLSGPENNTLFLNIPDKWNSSDLEILESLPPSSNKQWIQLESQEELEEDIFEITSLTLPDGNTLQIGEFTVKRDELLDTFKSVFIIAVLPVILFGLAGGAFLMYYTLQPARDLIQTVQSIISTGEFSARVKREPKADEIGQLVLLINELLNKTELLIKGMRSSLDNVAHDLRTPMTRLRSLAESALQSEQKGDARSENLIDIIEELERIATILNMLLDISEAEAGIKKLCPENLNIEELMRDAIDLYSFIAEERCISVNLLCPEDVEVVADRTGIRCVLANLLDNAVKYTLPGGRVDIEARRDQKQVVVTVKDDGEGIPPEDIPHIWDRLYRCDATRSQPGLGLGLSLVKAIVRAHGGDVDVVSTPGKGSTFSIHLPATL